MILQLSAWLYGSAISKLIGSVLVHKLGLNLFPFMEQMLMPAELAVEKSLDLTIFVLTIVLSGIVFGLNLWAMRKGRETDDYLDWIFLGFSFLLFFQVWFGHLATPITLIIALVMEGIYFGLRSRIIPLKPRNDEYKWKDFHWQNALLFGYWLMTIVSMYTTSLLLPITMILLAFGIYIFLSKQLKKFTESPVHLLFVLTLFLPLNFNLLLFGLLVLGLIVVWGFWVKKEYRLNYLYDAAIITLFTYNPKFYVGNYDFIEEGVWLGWLQKLSLGGVLYRDILAYHPPLIIKFLEGLMSVFGMSIYTLRLGFQIMRVLGLIFYFYLLKEALESKWSRMILMIIAVGITNTLVRNNVEIRLGVGLLAILFWYKALKSDNKYWHSATGIVVALACLTSLEVGAASGIATFLGHILLGGKKKIINLGWWFFGGLLIGLPVMLRMLIEGAFFPAIDQLTYYSSVFSKGYFNLPILLPPVSAYLHWSLFDEYLSSPILGWQLAILGILLGLFLAISKVIEKKSFEIKDKLIVVLTLFSAIVFRGALGRSDWYHLLFVLLASLVVVAVVLERTLKERSVVAVLGLILILFARENGLRMHIDEALVNWQTHGEVLQKTQSYNFERMGVKVDETEEIYKLNDIVAYLEKNTEKKQEVFMFPWMPDLYFFADLKNPTKNDIPYAFFQEKYQMETIKDLEKHPDALVVFNPLRSFAGFDISSVGLIRQYIEENYETIDEVDSFQIMRKI